MDKAKYTNQIINWTLKREEMCLFKSVFDIKKMKYCQALDPPRAPQSRNFSQFSRLQYKLINLSQVPSK
jgi:hypothetical protein